MKRFWMIVSLLIFCMGFRVEAQEKSGEDDLAYGILAALFTDPWLALLYGFGPSDNDDVTETDTIKLSDTEQRILDAIAFREVWLDDIKENKAKMGKHLVQKGEDWESVAAIYGLTKGDLIAVNPFIEDCYIGLEIDVPIFLSEYQIKENKLVQKDAGYILAKEYYDSGDYKKALKQYDNIEKSGKSTLLSRYNSGLCRFRLGKYGKCVSDMKYVIVNDTDNLYPEAKHIMEKANTAMAERNERIANIIGGVLQAGAQAYGQYAYMNQMQEWQSNGISPSGEIIDPSKLSNEYKEKLLDPNFAVQQYWASEFQEYQTFGRNLKKPDGSNYSFQEWQLLKAQTQMNDAGNGVGTTSDDDSNSTSSSITRKARSYNVVNYEEDCPQCHTTGNCPTCYKGVASGFGFDFDCPNCRANPGKCSKCNGTGKITKARMVKN